MRPLAARASSPEQSHASARVCQWQARSVQFGQASCDCAGRRSLMLLAAAAGQIGRRRAYPRCRGIAARLTDRVHLWARGEFCAAHANAVWFVAWHGSAWRLGVRLGIARLGPRRGAARLGVLTARRPCEFHGRLMSVVSVVSHGVCSTRLLFLRN